MFYATYKYGILQLETQNKLLKGLFWYSVIPGICQSLLVEPMMFGEQQEALYSRNILSSPEKTVWGSGIKGLG